NPREARGDQSDAATAPPGCRKNFFGTARAAQEGLAMRLAAKGVTAILSVITISAALSLPLSTAFAGDDKDANNNVTEDQIVRALAPAKKPLTRGLSVGPQTTDPAPSAAETKLLQTVRGRATRSLSVTEREEIAAVAKDKPNIDLEITFNYNSADI